MRIKELEDGKIQCYAFGKGNDIHKDLTIDFIDEQDMLVFFKNAYDKVVRYKNNKIGNESIWRIYKLFEFSNDVNAEELDKFWEEFTPSDRDLFEFRMWIKEKRENEQQISAN